MCECVYESKSLNNGRNDDVLLRWNLLVIARRLARFFLVATKVAFISLVHLDVSLRQPQSICVRVSVCASVYVCLIASISLE